MEQRMTDAEGDIRQLQEWRRDRVDPWLGKSDAFHFKTETFMTKFEAAEAVRMQLADERHKSNSMKLDVLMFLVAFVGLLFTALLALFGYEAAHQKALLGMPAIHVQNQQYDAQRNPGAFDSAIPNTIAMHPGMN